MRIVSWFKEMKQMIGYTLKPVSKEIDFWPIYDQMNKMTKILESKGHKLEFKASKRGLAIVGFNNLEELNNFLIPFRIIAKPRPLYENGALLSHITDRFMRIIELRPMTSMNKKHFEKNLGEATSLLFNKSHIKIFWWP